MDGGEDEDRTHDLRIANAALSQLSYPPKRLNLSTALGGARQAALNMPRLATCRLQLEIRPELADATTP